VAKSNDTIERKREATLYEQGDADWLRHTLSRSAFYPTGDMRGDPGQTYYEHNLRQNLLPAMLERLDLNDLEAIYRMTEALAIYPVWERFWEEATEYHRGRLEYLKNLVPESAQGLFVVGDPQTAEGRAADGTVTYHRNAGEADNG
jgi:hypothetical protein